MQAPLPTRRCFVSLDLPPEIHGAAVQMQEVLRRNHPELRFTAPENLHLTLKFLGEITEPMATEVTARLQGIHERSLSIQVTGAGCFAPRIIWISVQGADALQKRIDQALQDLFEPEHRFMGHITIARPRRISEPLRRAVESLDMTVLSAEVPGFSLQISHLSHLGPRYETRARFELGSLRP